jgi:hypothetical protein
MWLILVYFFELVLNVIDAETQLVGRENFMIFNIQTLGKHPLRQG